MGANPLEHAADISNQMSDIRKRGQWTKAEIRCGFGRPQNAVPTLDWRGPRIDCHGHKQKMELCGMDAGGNGF